MNYSAIEALEEAGIILDEMASLPPASVAGNAPDERTRRQYERRFLNTMVSFLNDQRKRVIKGVKNG